MGINAANNVRVQQQFQPQPVPVRAGAGGNNVRMPTVAPVPATTGRWNGHTVVSTPSRSIFSSGFWGRPSSTTTTFVSTPNPSNNVVVVSPRHRLYSISAVLAIIFTIALFAVLL
jgi:hypothetical protein